MDDLRPPSQGGSDAPLFTSRRRRRESGRPPYGVLALVLLVVLTAGAVYWFGFRSRGAPDAGTTDTREMTRPDAADRTVEAPDPNLPPLDASDVVLREVVRTLSEHPLLAEWLVTDDLARRFVTSVVNISAGGSPAEHLRFMAPQGPFTARQGETGLVVDPASYARYDRAVEAFTSMDTESAARLYRRLRPLFEEAYAELGLPGRSFDETLAVAIGNLLAVEVPDGPIGVEPSEAVYAYADPELEALAPAEKHLLRLGPENARRVQAELRELADALGLEPRPARESPDR